MSGPAILLDSPKFGRNLGNVHRACACFGVSNLYWTGDRIEFHGTGQRIRLPREERLSGYQSVRSEQIDNELMSVVQGRTPIAIEARRDFQSLVWFEHPSNPLYIFGPEDGSLSGRFTSLAHAHVAIPSLFCTNLAAAVYIVLYDRHAKAVRNGAQPLQFAGRTVDESWLLYTGE